MNINKIIVASHGTPGAKAAEETAIKLSAENGAELQHLFVVPDFWKGMMGDDWLNNASTRIIYGEYVENQLEKEAVEEINRISKAAKALGVELSHHLRVGKPADCLIEFCAAESFDLAVIGSPRPKGTPGYRSRMKLEPLARSLNIPLMIIPHPKPCPK